MSNTVYLLLALLLGALLPVQSGANGVLGRTLGSPYVATPVVFLVAALGIAVVLVGQRTPLPPLRAFGQVPWWGWLGGLLAVGNILGFILLPPRIGIGTLIGLFVTGQILSSVLLDHFGSLHFPVHPLTGWRLVGVALLVTGVFLIKKF
jgi:bacterial/archaeal transporter family-2 protein